MQINKNLRQFCTVFSEKESAKDKSSVTNTLRNRERIQKLHVIWTGEVFVAMYSYDHIAVSATAAHETFENHFAMIRDARELLVLNQANSFA